MSREQSSVEPSAPPRAPRQGGAVALVTMLVLMAVALALTTGLNLLGVSEASLGTLRNRSAQALFSAEACVEEGLLRVARDAGYTGGTLDVGGISCSVTVLDLGGGARRITGEATISSVKRRVQADTQTTTLTLSGRPVQDIVTTAWKELTE